MDSNSLSDSLVSEQDLASFRSIFDHKSREAALEFDDDSINNPHPLQTGLKVKSIIGVVAAAIIVTCLFVIWPVNSYRYTLQHESATKLKSKQKPKLIFEPTMTPDRTNNIKVFGVRTTQPPPSILIDSSYFFPEEKNKR